MAVTPKPAPTLPDASTGGLGPLRDLGWLLGSLAATAPLAVVAWLAIALGTGLLVPAQLWLTKALVDALAAQLRSGAANGTALWLGLLVVSLLLERVLGGVQPWLEALVRETASAAVKERVMRKAVTLDLASFEYQGYFDQLDRVMSGVESRVPRLLQAVLQGLQTLPQFLGYGAALLTLSPVLPLIVLAAVIPVVVGFTRSGQSNWGLLSAQTRDRRLAGYYAELLSSRPSAKEVRLYGLSDYLRSRWATLYWQTRNSQRRQALRQGLRQRGMVLGTVAVSMLGLSWVVAARLLHASAGGYALLFQSLQGMIGTTFTLSSAVQSYGEHAGYANALRAFLRQSEEAVAAVERAADGVALVGAGPRACPAFGRQHPLLSGTDAGRPRGAAPTGAPTNAVHPTRQPFPQPVRQGISFEDVWFIYPGSSHPALAGVSFLLTAGTKVALVGENGAGKTTLTKLLLGLYRPDQGTITVDGTDMREIDPASLRMATSAVLQQFTRYQLSLAENIALAAPDQLADRERLALAVEQAGARDVVQWLASGYETLLGPDVGGVDLSGGQWQRLALARAFFRDAQVLVLDEPTAALDPLAELALFERFAALASGKTALLTSHRLGMARLADRVLVLADGRLVEAGTHEELLRQGGAYATLFDAQARWYR